MRLGRRIAKIASVGGALAIPLLPKCPLCLLPLLTAAGVAMPPGPLLDALVAVAAAGWLTIVLSTARRLPVKGAAVAAAMLLVGGRGLGFAWTSWIGCALMLAVAWGRFRPSACGSVSCLRASP